MGLVPGQVSTVTTRPGATWEDREGAQCGAAGPSPLPFPHGAQAHLHFLTAQAQLAGSLLEEGHRSPCGHSVSGLLCLQLSPDPRPRQGLGHSQRGADPECAAASPTQFHV